MKWIQRLKDKWGIKTDKDFWLIMLVFSLAGVTTGSFRRMILPLIGFKSTTPLWINILASIPLCTTVYMLGTILWGNILGQAWFFNPRMKRRIDFLLRRKNV